MIICECDGASRGNPGLSASSFRIVRGKNVLHTDSQFLGDAITNNEAEYRATINCLKFLHEQWRLLEANKDAMTIHPDLLTNAYIVLTSDSQLVMSHLTGVYRVKEKKLQPLFQEALQLIMTFPRKISLVWKPREQLQEVDRLNNITLDKHAKSYIA